MPAPDMRTAEPAVATRPGQAMPSAPPLQVATPTDGALATGPTGPAVPVAPGPAAGISAWWLLPRRLMIGVVQAYRYLLKPWLGSACRFEPTCSQYALDALRRHGAIVGGALAGGRLLRCHPWCDGGLDPVPARAPGLFTRLGLGAVDEPLSDRQPDRNPS